MSKILQWAKTYHRPYLKGDVFAGITTGVLLIPQGMAYALIAGLPPIYGLYAAVIPPVIYAIFCSSYHLSVGPAATVSLLIFAGLRDLRFSGEEFILAASMLAMMVGAIQFIFGVSRLGFIVNFLSRPVISGYTSAAAIIIIVSQVKNLMGIEGRSEALLEDNVRHTLQHLGEISIPTLLFGLGALAFLIISKKINSKIPGPLLAVLLSIGLIYFLNLEAGTKILGAVPSGLPSFQYPGISIAKIQSLIPLAFIVALVGFLESISISKSLQVRNKGYSVNANIELISLGLANFVGAFFKAFPVSGGFSRSAVNEQAGAKTPLATIVSAALVALVLLLLTPMFYYLPKSVLAAIIILAATNLINYREAAVLWKISRRDFWMMAATIIATLGIGIQAGIITGVIISLVVVIYKSTYPHTALLGKLPETGFYRNLLRFPEAADREDALIFRFDSQLYFANIQYFIDTLCAHVAKRESTLKVIVINAQAINSIDTSAIFGLTELIKELKKRGIAVYFTRVIGPVRDVMRKSGLYDLIGDDHFGMRIQDALDHFDRSEKDESHTTAFKK